MKKSIKKVFAIALAASMSLGSYWSVLGANFTDLDSTNSYHSSIEKIGLDIINGYLNENGVRTARPDSPITREEFAAYIGRAFNYNSIGGLDDALALFPDSTAVQDWAKEYMIPSVAFGIITGKSGVVAGANVIDPKGTITRQEAITMLARAAGYASAAESFETQYTDIASVADYALDSVKALEERGIFFLNHKVEPAKAITRAEAAYFVYNVVRSGKNLVITEAKSYSGGSYEDVIVSPSVGNGEVTLTDVEINGELVVQGGGENSIILAGRTKIKRAVTISSMQFPVSIKNKTDIKLPTLSVMSNKNVSLQGLFSDVKIVEGKKSDVFSTPVINAVVNLVDATVSKLVGSASVVKDIVIGGKSAVSIVVIAAANTKVTVSTESTVETANVGAENVTLQFDNNSVKTAINVLDKVKELLSILDSEGNASKSVTTNTITEKEFEVSTEIVEEVAPEATATPDVTATLAPGATATPVPTTQPGGLVPPPYKPPVDVINDKVVAIKDIINRIPDTDVRSHFSVLDNRTIRILDGLTVEELSTVITEEFFNVLAEDVKSITITVGDAHIGSWDGDNIHGSVIKDAVMNNAAILSARKIDIQILVTDTQAKTDVDATFYIEFYSPATPSPKPTIAPTPVPADDPWQDKVEAISSAIQGLDSSLKGKVSFDGKRDIITTGVNTEQLENVAKTMFDSLSDGVDVLELSTEDGVFATCTYPITPEKISEARRKMPVPFDYIELKVTRNNDEPTVFKVTMQ
ncbi:MAG: S-layer homology domain-containing protein [Clostridiales bacterium]|nr:S-layer homology domain-containing protein [Clostridiales bacterium]